MAERLFIKKRKGCRQMANEFRVWARRKNCRCCARPPKLKEIDPNASIDIACHSYCGPGRKKTFVVVISGIGTALTEDELMGKVRAKLK